MNQDLKPPLQYTGIYIYFYEPDEAALVVGECVLVHPGQPKAGEGEEGPHQATPHGQAQLCH